MVDKVTINFEVGNTYNAINDNVKVTKEGHECVFGWTLFLKMHDKKQQKMIDKLVDHVEFGMW